MAAAAAASSRPSVLQRIARRACPRRPAFPQLLVGTETGDDAAVWQIDESTCDRRDHRFLHADGGRPVRFRPHRRRPTRSPTSMRWAASRSWRSRSWACRSARCRPRWCARSSTGGAAVCAEAGIPVAGGHSIDSPEPIYGLAVIGLCRSADAAPQLRRARAGDALILTKPLGVGIYSAALKAGSAGSDADRAYAEMVASTTQLNAVGRGARAATRRSTR